MFNQDALAALPMLVPTKVTEADLGKSIVGQRALALVKEGIQQGYLHGKKVEKFLRKISESNKKGTCVGQASAVMIADKGSAAGKEKEVLFRASEVDVVAFQLLGDVECTLANSMRLSKFLAPELQPMAKIEEKVDAKVKKIEEKTVGKTKKKKLKKLKAEQQGLKEELQKLQKQVDKKVQKAVAVPGTQVVFPKKIEELALFRKKVIAASRELVEQQGGYQFIGKEKFSKGKGDKFCKYIKKLASDSSQKVALRVTMMFKEQSAGHAFALFINPRNSVYDSSMGMTKHAEAKKFAEQVEEIYGSKGLYTITVGKPEKYSIEIFRRK